MAYWPAVLSPRARSTMTEKPETSAEQPAAPLTQPMEALTGSAGEFERGIHLVHDVSAPADVLPPSAALAPPSPQDSVGDPSPAPAPPAADGAD